MYQRNLKIQLPAVQSAFLWGARKTGKSTYLKGTFPNSLYYDFLKNDVFLRFNQQPHLFREEISALEQSLLQQPIILDEVQKIPAILDEVHWLIENQDAQFILCGSSARKLRRGAANLLGGRAWRYHFFPLTSPEIPDFDLLKALQCGLIPSHYDSSDIDHSLEAYIEDYLKEEIQAEALVRRLSGFQRFLDAIGFSQGEMVNFTNIARECGVDAKTVKAYYQILEDTLIGYWLTPFRKKGKRRTISETPKFYLFDIGVANYLARQHVIELKGSQAGKAFEHFVFLELIAYRGLQAPRLDISYWRTKSQLEVDFILGQGEVAIEVKIQQDPQKVDLKGLVAFVEEHQPKRAIVVCQAPAKRVIKLAQGCVEILPWQSFLEELWQGTLLYS